MGSVGGGSALAYRTMSTPSTTANTPYRTVNTINDVSTDPTDTVGDTESAVVSTPNTDQGCRPISVKIQPTALARNGSAIEPSAAMVNHLPRGDRPRRNSH